VVLDLHAKRPTEQSPLAFLEHNAFGAITRVALCVSQPEGYQRAKAVEVSARLRRLAIRERLYDLVSIYTQNLSLQPAFLSSVQVFRQHTAVRVINLSDFEAFTKGDTAALTAAFTGPKGSNIVARLKLYMERVYLGDHTQTILALVKKVGVPDGSATLACWRSPSVVAKYGPIRSLLWYARPQSQRKQACLGKGESSGTTHGNSRRSEDQKSSDKRQGQARKERQKKNATPAERMAIKAKKDLENAAHESDVGCASSRAQMASRASLSE
jgi:hypothetical protein